MDIETEVCIYVTDLKYFGIGLEYAFTSQELHEQTVPMYMRGCSSVPDLDSSNVD